MKFWLQSLAPQIQFQIQVKFEFPSSFCLDELATILDCLKRKRLLVLPVFYNVDNSQVRLQEGSYGEALVKHEESLKHSMEKLEKWKMALHQVANLSDFKIKHGYSTLPIFFTL